MGVPTTFLHRDSDPTFAGRLAGWSDDRVVRELQAGNNDAFAEVFRRYHRLVHVTALRLLRDASEAEDLTQAVFLEIYRKVGQFDPSRGTLKVWLLQYAYSRSMSRRNYLQARAAHIDTAVENVDEVAAIWSPLRLPSQEASLLTEQMLNVLPETQRETIRMFFFQGLTLRDISERRRETLSSVRHHYYRGLRQLRELLREKTQITDSKRKIVSFHEVRRAET